MVAVAANVQYRRPDALDPLHRAPHIRVPSDDRLVLTLEHAVFPWSGRPRIDTKKFVRRTLDHDTAGEMSLCRDLEDHFSTVAHADTANRVPVHVRQRLQIRQYRDHVVRIE